jgi:hypothetical protein
MKMGWFGRMFCAVGGHRWQILRIAPCLVRFSEDELVGCDADCLRCDRQIRDCERYAALQDG